MLNIQRSVSENLGALRIKFVRSFANTLIHTIFISLLLLFFYISSSAASDGAVGFVRAVKGTAMSETQDGQSRPLPRNAEIFLNDQITTGDRSFVVITFKDDSVVTVRPQSKLKIEEFLFGQKSKKATLNLTKGGLRIITGKISKNQPENYRLKTPVASMGVRGTRFDARLCESDCASEERLITHSE
ncbi:FecR domain-containing protein [Pseudomonadota bacterium]